MHKSRQNLSFLYSLDTDFDGDEVFVVRWLPVFFASAIFLQGVVIVGLAGPRDDPRRSA